MAKKQPLSDLSNFDPSKFNNIVPGQAPPTAQPVSATPTPQPATPTAQPVSATPTPQPAPSTPDIPQIIRDQNTGRISGVTIAGRTTFTNDMNTINAILQHHAPQPTPQGSVEASQIALQPSDQQLSSLAAKQQQELQGINALQTNEPPLASQAMRNVQAGAAFIGNIQSNLGVQNPITSADVGTPPNAGFMRSSADTFSHAILGTIGIASTKIEIAGFSFSSLFDTTTGSIASLKADSGENVAESTKIARAATSKGANLQEAISSEQILEDATRAKYARIDQLIRRNPKDLREGISFQDSMARDLRNIVENRQALERYKLTGDVNQVLLTIGTGTGT